MLVFAYAVSSNLNSKIYDRQMPFTTPLLYHPFSLPMNAALIQRSPVWCSLLTPGLLTQTVSFKEPYRKKSNGIRSEELGGRSSEISLKKKVVQHTPLTKQGCQIRLQTNSSFPIYKCMAFLMVHDEFAMCMK